MFNLLKKKIVKKKEKGFTIIESMVAITILLISVVAPLSLAQEGIFASRLAQNQIVAYYLAQEGIELVLNLRDQNILQSSNDPIGGALRIKGCLVADDQDLAQVPAHGCAVDATENPANYGDAMILDICNLASGCPNILIGVNNGDLYTQGTGGTLIGKVETLYSREIKIWYPNDNSNSRERKELVVESTVTWTFNRKTQSYSLRSNILDI